MNIVQRFFSNTVLIFVSNAITKVSNSILFIYIGRLLGPDNAGIFNLGITYYTITMALSAWGLSELLIREVAHRRQESSHYLINYLPIRLTLNALAYGLLLLLLRLNLPYTPETKQFISVISLTIFPESLFILFQAMFIAHERVAPPAIVASINSILKLSIGFWILYHQADISLLAWLIPLSSLLNVLILLPFLIRLLHHTPQTTPWHFNLSFSLSQMRFMLGFIIIGIFSTLDFQIDALLISIFLDTENLGWFSSAQTLVLGFWMMPTALRSALYPIMARYHQEDYNKLVRLYQVVNRYLIIIALPITVGVALLVNPIINLIYTDSFAPAAAVLQIMIWAVLFSFLDVPNARLMLIYNKQIWTAWITGISMMTNILLNLWLIPTLGIRGAAIARTVSSFLFTFLIYLYVQFHFIRSSIIPYLWRPLFATIIMSIAVFPFRNAPIYIPVLFGAFVYSLAIILLKAIPSTEQQY